MESPVRNNAGSTHCSDGSGGGGTSRQRSVLVVGNLTSEQLARVKDSVASILGEVQGVTFTQPSSSSSAGPSHTAEDGSPPVEQPPQPVNFLDGMNHSKPAMVQVNSGLESVCKKLQSVAKLENKVLKAVSAIAHYQKQQQDLADNFVRLSNKYQELKANFHTVLWSYMPRLSEFSEIPALDPSLEETDTQVGHFSVGLLVGKGHFAEVKVCSLASDERRLVIKAIDKQRVKNLNGLQRIGHEIEALKNLRHPNILTLYSVLHGKHFMYLVTERLSSDLYEFIGEHSSGVGEPLAKKIITPIMDAVLFMHTKGFVHRDLKPENILLDYTGSAATGDFIIKVCDFGLCEKIVEENAVLTEFCGSPGFMAPEMVIDRQYDGKKADLWSIGCILLELLLTAKEFSTIWMKNFQDEFLEDPLRFKRQLYSTWTQVESTLKCNVSEDLYMFVSGLLKIDPMARLSSSDLYRVMTTGVMSSAYRGATTASTAKLREGSPSFKPGGAAPMPTKPPTYRHSESAPENLSGGPVPSNLIHNHNNNNISPSRLSPTPMGCHPISSSSSGSSSAPHSSTASASAPIPTTTTTTTKVVRPRPTQRHSSSARNSLRAQTLLKLESLSVNHHYARGRNPGLGPLSPGTPDVGIIAKKFFEEDPQAASPGSPINLSTSSSSSSCPSSSSLSSPPCHPVKPATAPAHTLSSVMSTTSPLPVTGAGVTHHQQQQQS